MRSSAFIKAAVALLPLVTLVVPATFPESHGNVLSHPHDNMIGGAKSTIIDTSNSIPAIQAHETDTKLANKQRPWHRFHPTSASHDTSSTTSATIKSVKHVVTAERNYLSKPTPITTTSRQTHPAKETSRIFTTVPFPTGPEPTWHTIMNMKSTHAESSPPISSDDTRIPNQSISLQPRISSTVRGLETENH